MPTIIGGGLKLSTDYIRTLVNREIIVLSIEELYSNVMKRPLESVLSNNLAKLRITDGHRNFTTIEKSPLTSLGHTVYVKSYRMFVT